MNLSDDNYTNIMLEEISGQNKAVLEVVGQMRDKMDILATKDELQAVADDVKVIKSALTETNKDVADLDRRVTVLESSSHAHL